jgi:hypothetical protein
MNNVGTIIRGPGWFRGVNDYDGLRWEERFYECRKHGALQVHDEDLLRRALNPERPGSLPGACVGWAIPDRIGTASLVTWAGQR